MDHALSCVLQTADGESESVEGAAQRGARGARIEAHKAFAAAAEHLAVVAGEVRLVHEKVDERNMVEAESAAVEPHQVRRDPIFPLPVSSAGDVPWSDFALRGAGWC